MVLFSDANAEADFVDVPFAVVMSVIPRPSYTIQKVGYILLSVLKPKIEQKGMADLLGMCLHELDVLPSKVIDSLTAIGLDSDDDHGGGGDDRDNRGGFGGKRYQVFLPRAARQGALHPFLRRIPLVNLCDPKMNLCVAKGYRHVPIALSGALCSCANCCVHIVLSLLASTWSHVVVAIV